MNAQFVRALPSLSFKCDFCGIEIAHESDTEMVTKVAAHHNYAMHQIQERRRPLGVYSLRWGYPIDQASCDALTEQLFAKVGAKADLWVDQFEVSFTPIDTGRYWKHEAETVSLEIAEIVASVVGGSFKCVENE